MNENLPWVRIASSVLLAEVRLKRNRSFADSTLTSDAYPGITGGVVADAMSEALK